MSVTLITDETTRDELATAIQGHCHRAKREFPRVGTTEKPTAWDKRHAAIDAMLTDYEHARDG